MDKSELFDKTKDREEYWRAKLTPEQYRVLREKGTETPFSGKYVHTKDRGIYKCAACGNELFSSETKFDSGTGWPSFTDPMNLKNVELKEDQNHSPPSPDSFGGASMIRTEVLCKKCGSHLGHFFDDLPAEVLTKAGGPAPHRGRYCINSVCLELEKNSSQADPR